MATNLHGVLTALAVPFNTEEEIDLPVLRKIIDNSVDNGVHGVVAGGSTGEFATMTRDERLMVVDEVTSHVNGRVPVIAQTGAITTTEAIRHSKAAQRAGADVLMLVTPYYEALSLDETLNYLREVAENVELPIMLYNIPGATGVNLDPDTIGSLADEFEHIKYVKDSGADYEQALQLIHHHGDRIGTIIGWDVYIYSALVEGAAGVMAGAANVVPAELSAVYDAIVGNDLVRARELWRRLYPTIDTMLSGDFIPAVKAGLELQGIPAGVPRRPMAPLSEQAYQALRADLDTLRSVFTS